MGDHVRFFTFRKLYLCVKGETTIGTSSSAVVLDLKGGIGKYQAKNIFLVNFEIVSEKFMVK